MVLSRSLVPAVSAGIISLFLGISQVSAQASPQVVDNGDTGFSQTSQWAYLSGLSEYYGNDVHYVQSGDGTQTATWSFSVVPGTTYRVATRWVAHSNRATDAPFQIAYSGSTNLVRVNQERTPEDFTASGHVWHTLGHYTIVGNQLTVTLSNDANEYVIADAVYIDAVPAGPEIKVTVDQKNIQSGVTSVDFGDTFQGAPVTKDFVVKNLGTAVLNLGSLALPSGFSQVGTLAATVNPGQSTTFTVAFDATADAAGNLVLGNNDSDESSFAIALAGNVSTVITIDNEPNKYNFFIAGNWSFIQGTGFADDLHYVYANGDPSTYVQWRTNPNIPQSRYRISATWVPAENRTTSARYLLWDNGPLQHVVNQENAPATFQDGGVWWEDLGVVSPSSSAIEVFLMSEGNEYVIADAIRIERLP